MDEGRQKIQYETYNFAGVLFAHNAEHGPEQLTKYFQVVVQLNTNCKGFHPCEILKVFKKDANLKHNKQLKHYVEQNLGFREHTGSFNMEKSLQDSLIRKSFIDYLQ